MTGEKAAWYRLAFHLHTLPRELAEKITFNEFLEWQVILEEENLWRIKQEHYWSLIAAEICRSRVKYPRKVKSTDFLLRFVTEEEETKIQRAKKSKAAWLGLFNIKDKD